MSSSVSRKPSAKSSPRGPLRGGVGDRVDQQLHAGPAPPPRGRAADHGRQVAAGAVAADRDAGRVGAERAALSCAQSNAASASSTAAGKGCSGASR